MILQSKTVYVKRQWIECQHCGYGWNSETKVTPETKKKRVCCSRCRSSITVYFSNEDDEDIKKPSKLVKTVQELEQAQNPQKVAELHRKLEEFERKERENEMQMNMAVQGLFQKYSNAASASIPSIPPTEIIAAAKEGYQALWNEKMKRMSPGQQHVFMANEFRKICDSFREEGGLSEEQMKPFERTLVVVQRRAEHLLRIEREEQMKAKENDSKYFKDSSKKSKRNKVKIIKKKGKVLRPTQ